MCAALVRHRVDYTIVRWVKATLEGQQAIAMLGSLSRSVAVPRGCPQGGVLSPLLWCLVADELLARLSGGGLYAQGYVDDICLLAVGKFPHIISGLIQWALCNTEPWCGKNPGTHCIEKYLLLCQNLNPGSSGPYPGHYADYTILHI